MLIRIINKTQVEFLQKCNVLSTVQKFQVCYMFGFLTLSDINIEPVIKSFLW